MAAVILSVQDLVFSLSLRMLGTFPDAEDATQDILLKIITHLSSFKGESAFSTWVFRIATNHLKNYQKHMFAKFPLSFEFYGDDIKNGKIDDVPDLTQNVEKSVLAEELKLSCTNVMLQCLDAESRCIFILGTMFKVDNRIAGNIPGIAPKAYRQQLSRIRNKMADFLWEYCHSKSPAQPCTALFRFCCPKGSHDGNQRRYGIHWRCSSESANWAAACCTMNRKILPLSWRGIPGFATISLLIIRHFSPTFLQRESCQFLSAIIL